MPSRSPATPTAKEPGPDSIRRRRVRASGSVCYAAVGRSERAGGREMGKVRARRRQLSLSLSGLAAQSRFSPASLPPCSSLVCVGILPALQKAEERRGFL
jgi:hypothetical protein